MIAYQGLISGASGFQRHQAGDVQLHAAAFEAGPLGDAALDAPQRVQVIGHHTDPPAGRQGVLPLLVEAGFDFVAGLHFQIESLAILLHHQIGQEIAVRFDLQAQRLPFD